MKNILFGLILLTTITVNAQIYRATQAEISFFSETPMENIFGDNKDAKAIINAKTNEIAFAAVIVSFHFEKSLMEEHFNEDYMESDKYKTTTFKGNIIGVVDYTKDGEYPVKVKGTLNIHGVDQEREIDGKIIVKDGKVSVFSEFNVILADHKITVPKLLTQKIAESVKVTVKGDFELKE